MDTESGVIVYASLGYGQLKTVHGWKLEKMARFSHLIVVGVDRKRHRHTGV